MGRGPAVLPVQQRTAGSLRHRARRLARRRQHAASKNRSRTAELDQWVLRFSSHPGARLARVSYRRRWATEGTYRAAQSGGDGHHGWDLGRLVTRAPSATAVERIVGLWALGTLLQCWLGHHAGQATAPTLVRQIVAQWTTTGRLSVWARGRLARTEPSAQLSLWLKDTLRVGTEHLAATPPLAPVRRLPARRPAPRQAA
ncbi:MAG: hypothetical protein HY329_24260 [Chloroflexi bacterium]|nr:hypothetical protein [Chloroflexota bacterium]